MVLVMVNAYLNPGFKNHFSHNCFFSSKLVHRRVAIEFWEILKNCDVLVKMRLFVFFYHKNSKFNFGLKLFFIQSAVECWKPISNQSYL